MTKRQKQVHKLIAQGLRQHEIAKRLGISQVRVSHILNPEKKQAYMKKWSKTEKAKESRRQRARIHRYAHPLEYKYMWALGVSFNKAKEMVDSLPSI